MKRSSQAGFTLIELMVAVVIVGILAVIAYPSYQQYVIRGKRAAAQAQMMDIANRQQQLLLANRSYYTHDSAVWTASGYSLPSDVSGNYSYTIAVGSGAVPSFTITFTPTGSQASDGNLVLDSAGNKSPAGKW